MVNLRRVLHAGSLLAAMLVASPLAADPAPQRGMFLLAATAAGQFAGADGLLTRIWKSVFSPNPSGSPT